MGTDDKWRIITYKRIRGILVYYCILLIIGLIVTTSMLIPRSQKYFDATLLSLFGSMGMSLIGSTISYIRKVYKACINLDIGEPEDNKDLIRQMGVTVYYVIRPIFALGFAILILICLKSGLLIMTKNNDLDLSNGFIYTSMFLSFFCGYSCGELIDVMENFGKSFWVKIFTRIKDND